MDIRIQQNPEGGWDVVDFDHSEVWGPYDTEAEAVRVKVRIENELSSTR